MIAKPDPVQELIDRLYDRIMVRESIKWEHARRSQGQKWRHLTEKILRRFK